MIRTILFFYCSIFFLNPALAAIQKMDYLLSHAQPLSQKQLPAPYDQLLTQPLMTQTLAKYYNTHPVIKTIDSYHDHQNHHFYRHILMLDENNKATPRVLETAFIQINFNQLPPKMVGQILSTNIPFGQLLVAYKIKIYTKDRRYFKLACSKTLEKLTHCRPGTTLYARKNTIVNAKNNQWIAKVVEILL